MHTLGRNTKVDKNGAKLEVKNVYSGYDSIDIVKDASLRILEGEIVALIGPNGSGKSTLLKTVLGFLDVRRGEIIFNGESIAETEPHKLIKKGIQYIPQGRVTFRNMTVDENLRMSLWTVENEEEIRKRKERALQQFPILKEKKNQKAHSLSGGQKQMLSLSRAVALEPDLLILDEPSLGLAPSLLDKIFETILEISDQGTTILMVEQNASRALKISDRGYVLDGGHIKFKGKGDDLLKNEEVRKLYLGG